MKRGQKSEGNFSMLVWSVGSYRSKELILMTDQSKKLKRKISDFFEDQKSQQVKGNVGKHMQDRSWVSDTSATIVGERPYSGYLNALRSWKTELLGDATPTIIILLWMNKSYIQISLHCKQGEQFAGFDLHSGTR